MKKIYTGNHRHVTTCSDFEVKFKDYLNFTLLNDKSLHDLLIDYIDLELERSSVRSSFNAFFGVWLQERKLHSGSLDISSLDLIFNNSRTTDCDFDVLFAYSNFFKRLNDQEAFDILYFYDVTLINADEEVIVEKILNAGTSMKIDALFEGSNYATFIKCVNSLKSRNFIQVREDEVYLNFKTKYV